MNKLLIWLKSNIPVAILVLVLAFLAFRPINKTSYPRFDSAITNETEYGRGVTTMDLMPGSMKIMPERYNNVAPQLDIQNRMTVTNTYMSLLVKSVREAIDVITTYTEDLNGYIVSSDISSPESLSTGSISLRVPTTESDSILNFLRSYGVKVVSESITGNDITDEYIDVEERLKTLETTKAKYEDILAQTNDIEQILIVNDRIISVQTQIDYMKGQLDYMTKTAESTLITVYLATDELELPFAPEERWDAKLVFKYAVRSLVETGRGIAEAIIWLGVYTIIWVPLSIGGVILIKRLLRSK